MNALTLTTITIRQDAEGRYCLNDLHKAATTNGANERTTEPSKFLSSAKTTDLVQELQATQNLGSLIEPVKEHKNAMSDIRNMCESLKIQSAEFSADYKDNKGRTKQLIKAVVTGEV